MIKFFKMNDSLKIKIKIANRIYPIVANNVSEEEGIRKAAKTINHLISDFEKNYAVGDKQDVLAMCALQFASKKEIDILKKELEEKKALISLNNMNDKIDKILKK